MEQKLRGFNVFTVKDKVEYNRVGKAIWMKGVDGSNSSTDDIVANLLYDILKVLQAKK